MVFLITGLAAVREAQARSASRPQRRRRFKKFFSSIG
jgi:hypothetical protein